MNSMETRLIRGFDVPPVWAAVLARADRQTRNSQGNRVARLGGRLLVELRHRPDGVHVVAEVGEEVHRAPEIRKSLLEAPEHGCEDLRGDAVEAALYLAEAQRAVRECAEGEGAPLVGQEVTYRPCRGSSRGRRQGA
jgi:hypothetical protein